jgi:hypothetical protein
MPQRQAAALVTPWRAPLPAGRPRSGGPTSVERPLGCREHDLIVLADYPNKGNDQTFQGAVTATITAAFSPNGGATKLVTDTIGRTKKQTWSGL